MGLRSSKPKEGYTSAHAQSTNGGLRVTGKLLRKLENSDRANGSQFASSSSSSSSSPPLTPTSTNVTTTNKNNTQTTMSVDQFFLQKHPELTQLLRSASKYNDALLKHEQNEIDNLAKYISEIEHVEKNPYEENHANKDKRDKLAKLKSECETQAKLVKQCFENSNGGVGSLASRCKGVVQSYEKCGQVALEAFVDSRATLT